MRYKLDESLRERRAHDIRQGVVIIIFAVLGVLAGVYVGLKYVESEMLREPKVIEVNIQEQGRL